LDLTFCEELMLNCASQMSCSGFRFPLHSRPRHPAPSEGGSRILTTPAPMAYLNAFLIIATVLAMFYVVSK